MSAIKQKKSKSIGWSPIDIQKVLCDKSDQKCTEIDTFINSNSAEEQLILIKSLVIKEKDPSPVVIRFLVAVYFHSPPKHPIKCFIVKYITKSSAIQESFAESLSQHMLSQMLLDDYCQYSAMVFRTVLCIENFPAGVAAVKLIYYKLSEYLVNCLSGCNDLLKDPTISPTKKSDIYNLEHSCLRLLVHIVQKLGLENYHENWSSIFVQFTRYIEQLIDDADLPMDTKSLCGILFLYMDIIKHGGSSNATTVVTKLLSANGKENYHILQSRSGQLAIYSGLATAAKDQLQIDVDGTPAIVLLLEKLIQLGESGPPCQATDVGVSRALAQLSRVLRSVPGPCSARAAAALCAPVCARLDHSADCVRHLAGDILEALVEYCVYLEKQGDSSPLSNLLRSLSSLPQLSRARFLAARRVVGALPPRRALRDVCDAREIIEALDVPHLQPAARATLETLLPRHSRVAGADEVFRTWVLPALEPRDNRPSDTALVAVLRLRPDLLSALTEYLREHKQSQWRALVCARLAGLPWRHCVSRAALLAAAVHTDEQVRLQALSLVGHSAKTRDPLAADELEFVRQFLRHNLNAHSTHFRQTVIAVMTKILERAARTGNISFCIEVRSHSVRQLRRGCAARVAVAMPLACTAQILCGDTGLVQWSGDEVETLLLTLADNYEANQTLALKMLAHCPRELLQKGYSTSLDVEDLLEQACSLKPAESLAAAYKMRLVVDRLPDTVTVPNDMEVPSVHVAAYVLSVALVAAARAQLAAAFAPLHCLAAVIHTVDERTLTSDGCWLRLCEHIAATCVSGNELAAHVVCAASPEGHLPSSCHAQHYRRLIPLKGGVATAQMVLMCAWRSVKEASLLLGRVCGALCAVRPTVAVAAAEGLRRLLGRCQHRGACEQATAGLALLLHRVSAVSPRVCDAWLEQLVRVAACDTRAHVQATRRGAGLPLLMQTVLSCVPHQADVVSRALLHTAVTADTAVRRALALNVLCALFKHSALEGATQPFVGEGLVVALSGADAHEWPERTASCLLFGSLCVRAFGVVRSRARLDVRNTLPARVFFARYPLMYDVMLNKLRRAVTMEREGSMLPAVYPALVVLARLRPALEGTSPLKVSSFEGVVFQCAASAVLRTRQLAAAAGVALLAPDRYLEDIQKTFDLLSSQAISTNLCHGLLLRLNIVLQEVEIQQGIVTIQGDRVVRHARGVVGGSRVEKGTGLVEDGSGVEILVGVDQGVSEPADDVDKGSGLGQKVNDGINQKKGLDNDLIDCMDKGSRVESLTEGGGLTHGVVKSQDVGKEVNVWGSTWILNQPCFLLIHEYANVLQKMLHRYPGCLPGPLRSALTSRLNHILSVKEAIDDPCRGPAVASCVQLRIEMASLGHEWDTLVDVCVRGLKHSCYEVVLSTLEYIEGLYGTTEHSNGTVLALLRDHPDYYKLLRAGYHDGTYLQCRRKCLRLLSLENNTQRHIIKDSDATDQQVIDQLLHITEHSHIAEQHMLLTSLLNFISTKLDRDSATCVLNVTRLMYRLCLEENADDVKSVLLDFLDRYIEKVLKLDLERLRDEDKFEYKATVISLLVILLEDDDYDTRQRASDVTVKLCRDVTTKPCSDDTASEVTSKTSDHMTSDVTRKAYCDDTTLDVITKTSDETDSDVTSKESRDVTTNTQYDVTASYVMTKTCDDTSSDVTTKEFSDVTTNTHCDVKTKTCVVTTNTHCDVTTSDDILGGSPERVIPSVCGEMLRGHVAGDGDGVALLVIIGLLKFGGFSDEDDGGDEYRVFDQSDRSNMFVEDALWSHACARHITRLIPHYSLQTVIDLVGRKTYGQAFKVLCREHVDVFVKLVAGDMCVSVGKVHDFVNILREADAS